MRPRRGGASARDACDFNPRTHVGCDIFFIRERGVQGDFNPRTHVGCDPKYSFGTPRLGDISIHAPTWGATRPRKTVDYSTGISIHAPTWGATHENIEDRHPCQISIHAPTWGATARSITRRANSINFNPRTHVGCDNLTGSALERRSQFQSTHPRGVRLNRSTIKVHKQNFNPRTHVGCDFCATSPIWTSNISIHAPTWGATRRFYRKGEIATFQSTHPRGVRLRVKK